MSKIVTKTFTGFCPNSQSEKDISIDYISDRDLQGNVFSAKGHYSCDDRTCKNSNCPIYENAPKSI